MLDAGGGGGGSSKKNPTIRPVPIISNKGQKVTKKDKKKANELNKYHSGKTYDYDTDKWNPPTPSSTAAYRGGSSSSSSSTPTYQKPPSYSVPAVEHRTNTSKSSAPAKGDEDLMSFMLDLRNKASENASKPAYDFFGVKDRKEFEQKGDEARAEQERLERIQQRLKNIDKAAPGSEPDLPERFMHRGNNKNNKLKLHWDQEYINSNLSDLTNPSQINFALNGILEQQFQDREDYFTTRNFDRSVKIKEVLADAKSAAFKGDYDYLDKYMKEHPEFNLDPVAYGSDFGITPEQIWKEWEEQRGSLSPEQREDARYRVDMTMRHYQDVRKSYRKTNKYIKNYLKDYEKSYNKSIDFGINKGGQHEIDAKAAGGAFSYKGGNERSQDEIALYERVAANGPKTKEERKAYKANLREQLGVDRLPTTQELLAAAAQQGTFDPSDDAQLAYQHEVLSNPAHPDTLAMYLGYAKTKGTKVKDEDLLDLINKPILKQFEQDAKDKEDAKQKAKEDDLKSQDGIWDSFGDVWEVRKDLPLLVNTSGGQVQGTVSPREMKENLANTPGLHWTLDKISRLGYGVAGAMNAWYQLDKEPEQSWSGTKGPMRRIVDVITSPVSVLTGKSMYDSVDDVLANPESLAEPFKDGYNQVFRGSNLPGIQDDITPITFSQVIANNALRDGQDNIFDQEWYQHVAGFVGDVAFDPLSYVGVGLVGNAIKVPANAAKGAVRTGIAKFDPAMELLGNLRRTDVSPVAEKVWRTQQGIARLGDNLDGVQYVSDSALFGARPAFESPVGRLSDEAITIGSRAYDPADVFGLKTQASQLSNDVGVLHVMDEVGAAASKNGFPVDLSWDLRINKLVEREGSKPYLYAEEVRRLASETPGYSEVRFGTGPKAEEGARLLREADELERTAALNRAGGMDEAQTKAFDDQAIQKRAALDAMADDPKIPGVFKHTLVEKYVRDGGMLPTTWMPRKALASAAGKLADEFPVDDRVITEALLLGPTMAARQSPKLAAQMKVAKDRLDRARKGMSSDKAGVRERSQQNMRDALDTLNKITMSGALRYIDATLQLKREGRLFSDQGKAAKLQDYRAQVRGDLATDRGDSYTGLANEVDESGSAFEQYRDYDFLESDYATVTDPNNFPGFMSREQQLMAVDQELTRQIDALRLDKDGKITGLPEQVAYDVSQMIPSSLRKPGGSIDGARLKAAFRLDQDANGNWVVRYNVPKEDAHFAEIMRGAIEAEYRGAYVARSQERLNWRKSGQAAKEVSTRAEQRFYERQGKTKPKNSDPIKPSYGYTNTEWARKFPEGVKNRHWLEKAAKNSADDTYDMFYAAGAPFKLKAPHQQRLAINGKVPEVDEPASLRKWASKQLKGDRSAVDDYMREVAERTHAMILRTDAKGLSKLMDETWNATVKARASQWDKGLREAKQTDELENASRQKAADKQALTPLDKIQIREKAFEDALNEIVDDVVSAQKVRRNWGNERLTINEQARHAAKEIKTEFNVRKRELEIKILEATDAAKAAEGRALLKNLEITKKNLLAQVEKARVEAHETKKIMGKRITEDHIIQVVQMPVRMEEKALQISIMGMKKNLQFTTGLFRGAMEAEKLVPKAATDNFANNFVRPTKQLNSQEAITFRAMWEGKTPVIIKAHLTRLAGRMGKVSEANRIAMMDAYRGGREYAGAQREFVEGLEQELKDIEDIFNGNSDFYKFKDLDGNVQSLSWYDIGRFLPDNARMDWKELSRQAKENGNVTIDGIMKAMSRNNNLNDPYRFAWTMRIAADQARQTQAIYHVMRNTFGVKVPPVGNAKRSTVLKLKEHGWQPIDEIGKDRYLFPAEAVNDMRLLLEFMKPNPSMGKFTDAFNKNKFVQAADTALGFWKQGVTIYNPGYYTRNGIGEIMATWLAGHNGVKHYAKAHKVHKWLKAEDHDLAALVEQWSVLEGKVPVDAVKGNQHLFTLKGGLKVTVEDVYKQYVHHGLKSTFANTDLDSGMRALSGEGLTDSKTMKGVRHLNSKVHDVGEGFEDYLRMAHFIAAMEKSGLGSIYKAAEKAAAEVRKYHFDYTDFSNYEKAYMLRAMPFYKWTRRGAPLMLAHLFMTPGKMTAIPKAMDAISGLGLDPVAALDAVTPGELTDDPLLSTSDVHDDKNGYLPDYSGIAPEWVKDLFAYQLNPAEDDEYANFLRIQTPQIDGLNALLNPTDSALLPLLNPMIKMPAELLRNQQLDPDSPYQIVGGEYNEAIGLNPVESLIAYAARNLQPGAGFLAKLSKNGKLGPLSMGDAKGGEYGEDYDTSRDVLSFLSGMGLYQGKNREALEQPAVGFEEVPDGSMFSGRQTGSGLEETPGLKPEEIIAQIVSSYANGGSGSGWRNFGSGWRNFGWRNFGGYGGGGYGGGYGGGSGGSNGTIDLWELLKSLEQSVDKGMVIDE